jgi:hypothetical protein
MKLAQMSELTRGSEWWQFAVIVALCSLFMAAGVVAAALGRQRPPAQLALGDMSDASIVEIRDDRGVTAVSGEFRSRIDVLGNTEKDAALVDRRGQRVVGEIEIEIPGAAQSHRRPELEVDVMGLAPRQTFVVVIDDRAVATFRTDDRGSFDMEIQEGEVPVRSSSPFQG